MARLFAAVDSTAIPLSGELHLTLSVEGKPDWRGRHAATPSPDWRVRGAPKAASCRTASNRTGVPDRGRRSAAGATAQHRTGGEVTDRVMTRCGVQVTTEVAGTG